MATNPGLSFKKVASKPTSGMTQGEIYFVTDDKTIYVATSATTTVPFYGGEVKNVEYLAKTGETEKTQLKFTMMDDTSWTMDFSDCASATEVTNALNSLNIAYSTTGTATQPSYDSKKTTYLNGNVSFGITTGASYVTVTETSDANLKLIRAASSGNTVTIDGINTPADSAEGDTYPNYAANKGYVDNIKCEYNSKDKYIYLKNCTDSENPKVLSTIDCTDFIKDGILDGTALITATATSQKVTINEIEYTVTGLTIGRTYIVFAWNASSGKSVQALDVTSLIDVYTAGDGISIDNNKISVKRDTTTGNPIVVGDDGINLNIDSTLGIEAGYLAVRNVPGKLTVNFGEKDSSTSTYPETVTYDGTSGGATVNINTKTVVATTNAGTSDSVISNAIPFINHIENDRVKSSIKLKGAGATTVLTAGTTGTDTDKATQITITSTDSKVTSVGNHYTPSGTTTIYAVTDLSKLSADVGKQNTFVGGITMDAKGHVTAIQTDRLYWNSWE